MQRAFLHFLMLLCCLPMMPRARSSAMRARTAARAWCRAAMLRCASDIIALCLFIVFLLMIFIAIVFERCAASFRHADFLLMRHFLPPHTPYFIAARLFR